eukprot:234309-Prorocentrum_minimum.AAC.1
MSGAGDFQAGRRAHRQEFLFIIIFRRFAGRVWSCGCRERANHQRDGEFAVGSGRFTGGAKNSLIPTKIQ